MSIKKWGYYMEKFAARVKELREARGLSQDAVGKIIGVKRYSVYTYEKAKNYPDVQHLIALADYFDVTTDYLLGRTDTPG